MHFQDAYRAMLKDKGWSQRDIAQEVGVSQGAVGNLLRKDDPSLHVMRRYVGPLGYEVALVPVGTRLPKGSYKLDGESR